MKDSLDKLKHIATMRDGGSLLVEFGGKRYFIDRGIGSPTNGKVFIEDRSGKVVTGKELEKLKVAIINSSAVF